MSDIEITKPHNGSNGNGTPALADRPGSPGPGYIGQVQPSVGVLQAARRYPLLVVLPALFLMLAGAFIAFQRTPVFTAESRLTVGRINLNAPGALAGYASATQALASQFARSATAAQVLDPVAEDLDIPRERVRKRVSASPIPESPIFTLKATARNEAAAIELANRASDSVVDYARTLNDRDPDSSALLGEYKRTASTLADREARADALKDRFDENPSAELRRSLARARASRNFWRLREQAIEDRYLAATGGEASSRLIEILNRADKATSDRGRWVQILGFAGLVAGALLGLGLATIVANRTVRRRLNAVP